MDTSSNNKLKCLVVGKTCVGKTALVMKYMTDKFQKNGQITTGINRHVKHIRENLDLEIWDTAGIEEFQSINRSCYHQANVAIFCYDLSNPNSKITQFDDYRNEVKALAENCKFYICACKYELFRGNSISRTEMDHEEYAKQNGVRHFITSSKNGYGIKELFNTIVEDFLRDYQSEQAKYIGHKTRVGKKNKKFLKGLNQQRNNILEEFDSKWMQIFRPFENEKNFLMGKMKDNFEKKEKWIIDFLYGKENYFDVKIIKEFHLNFKDVNLEHGINIITTPNLSSSFNRAKFNNRLKMDGFDYLFMERIDFLNLYQQMNSVFIKFFEEKPCDKGFALHDFKIEHFGILKIILSDFPFVTTIIFCKLTINDESFLSEGLSKSCRFLKRISFIDCDMDFDPSALQSALRHSKLNQLSLLNNRCNFSGSVGQMFKSVENSASSLTIINLAECRLTSDDCKLIGNILDKCCSIEKIDLQGNRNMKDGFRFICNRLKRSAKCLQYINFSDCNLTEEYRIISLLEACKKCKLTTIFLKENPEIKSSLEDYFNEKMKDRNIEFFA